MNKKYIQCLMAGVLSLSLCSIEAKDTDKKCSYTCEQQAKTDAGTIDFSVFRFIRFPSAYQKISCVSVRENTFELPDGSKWSTSKIDIVKGWEDNAVVITTNHATFSTHRYALVNKDLKMAVPVSLEREPIPQKDVTFFVKNVDQVNDLVTLNDGKRWIIHSSDSSGLGKIKEYDRIVIGINTGEDWGKSPYILINTLTNNYVRANLID